MNNITLYGADWCPDCIRAKNVSNITSLEYVPDEKGLFHALKVRDNDSLDEMELHADGVFIFIGLIPNTNPFKGLVKLNSAGFIKTSGLVETSVQGIFAAGDCREGAIAQVAAATGVGVMASYASKNYLK